MLWLVLALSGALLEVEEAEEVFPGSARILVQHLSEALGQRSGCQLEVRWCDTQRCSEAASRPAAPSSRLHVVAGAESMQLILSSGGAGGPMEEIWPSEPATWRERAQALAARVYPRPVCAAPEAAPRIETTGPSAAAQTTVAVLALSAAAALGVGIGLHVLAGQTAAGAEAEPLWRPEVEDRWASSESQRAAGNISLLAAAGLAGVAVLWQLVTH